MRHSLDTIYLSLGCYHRQSLLMVLEAEKSETGVLIWSWSLFDERLFLPPNGCLLSVFSHSREMGAEREDDLKGKLKG